MPPVYLCRVIGGVRDGDEICVVGEGSNWRAARKYYPATRCARTQDLRPRQGRVNVVFPTWPAGGGTGKNRGRVMQAHTEGWVARGGRERGERRGCVRTNTA